MTKLDATTKEHASLPEISEKLKRRPNLRLIIPLSLLITSGLLLALYLLSPPKLRSILKIFPISGQMEQRVINLSGRIEGYETDVGAKTGGRVDYVAVREGDLVRKNQVIVRINDTEVQAQLRGALAQIAKAQAQANQSSQKMSEIKNQSREAELNLQQAKVDSQGRIYQAIANVAQSEAQLGQAEAQVNQAEASLKLSQVNYDRYAQLVSEGASSKQQFDQAKATFASDKATLLSRIAVVNAARQQVNAAQGALVQAHSTGLNSDIRKAQIDELYNQLAQAQSQLKAAQAEVKNAIASRQQIVAQISYLNVVSPIDGVVTARSVEPGEVVTSGKTLLIVINPKTVYLRGYVPEGSIGQIRVNQRAKVFLDSAPNKPLLAWVSAIDTEASFTPENIYFHDDRVKQVFGIKIAIDQPGGFAKPGMPADANIFTKPEAP